MDDGLDPAELEPLRLAVAQKLRAFEPVFRGRGLQVTGVRIDTEPARRYPELVVSLIGEDVEGERELQIGIRAPMRDAGEISRHLFIWANEVTPAGLERLRRAPSS